MLARIQNFRGLVEGMVEIAPIALVAGLNEAGKTSLCQVIAAAASGVVLPVTDGRGKSVLRKSDAGQLVHEGSASGEIVLTNAGGEAKITWPDCLILTDGRPPDASPIACGLVTFSALDTAQRSLLLIDVLKATPDRSDLEQGLTDAGLDPHASSEGGATAIDRLWGLIERDGWDVAHTATRERGARLKGAWEEITHTPYGAKKAATWVPEGWTDNLIGRALADLEAEVGITEAAHEAVVGTLAVTQAEAARLTRLAEAKPAAEAEAAAAADRLIAMEADAIAAEGTLAITPAADGYSGAKCPWCDNYVRPVMESYGIKHLEKYQPSGDLNAFQAIYVARKQAEEAVASARASLHQARVAKADAERSLRDSVAAIETLAKADVVAEGAHERLISARTAAERARDHYTMARARERASELHIQILANTTACGLLEPQGLRRLKLARRIGELNDQMAQLCASAGWPKVSVAGDLSIRWGHRPHQLASGSAKWRCDVIIQLALARLEKAALVIIDAADVLDTRGRNGLLKMLMDAGQPALLAMTYNAKRLVPQLGEYGQSYWIEGGRVLPLGPAKGPEEML